MAKYRIVKITNPSLNNEVSYQIEGKFLFMWCIIHLSNSECSNFASFKTLEEAVEFILGGCKDPMEIKKEVVRYIEIKDKWADGSAKVVETQ